MFKIFALAMVMTVKGPIPFMAWYSNAHWDTVEECTQALTDERREAIAADLMQSFPKGTPLAIAYDCKESGEPKPQGRPA
jgi:hypothetical protein